MQADSQDRRRQRPVEEPDAVMHVASQASVRESQVPQQETVNVMVLNMLQTMQKNQETREQRNITMLEQQRKDIEMRLKQQQKDMEQRIEQQRKDMITISERSM
jgi:hypothetical protein